MNAVKWFFNLSKLHRFGFFIGIIFSLGYLSHPFIFKWILGHYLSISLIQFEILGIHKAFSPSVIHVLMLGIMAFIFRFLAWFCVDILAECSSIFYFQKLLENIFLSGYVKGDETLLSRDFPLLAGQGMASIGDMVLAVMDIIFTCMIFTFLFPYLGQFSVFITGFYFFMSFQMLKNLKKLYGQEHDASGQIAKHFCSVNEMRIERNTDGFSDLLKSKACEKSLIWIKLCDPEYFLILLFCLSSLC